MTHSKRGHSASRHASETAGLLARSALAMAAERMGGRPPEPFLEGEEQMRATLLGHTRERLGLSADDNSDQALAAIEDELDAQLDALEQGLRGAVPIEPRASAVVGSGVSMAELVSSDIARAEHVVHKLKARDSTGRWAYYFVRIMSHQETAFRSALKEGHSIDLEDYGEVIASVYETDSNPEVTNSRHTILSKD